MAKIHKRSGTTCSICIEDIEGEGIILHKTRRQTHKLCIDCGIQYLTPIIRQITNNIRQNIYHRASTIKCTGTHCSLMRNQCTVDVDIRTLKIPEHTQLYTDIFRILYVLDNQNIYVCINKNCGNIIEIHPDDPITKTKCDFCSVIWCRHCLVTPFHDNMNCVEYEASQNQSKNGKLLWEKIKKGEFKFCPSCRMLTEKFRNCDGKFIGCNKISCLICGIEWCWLCMKVNIGYDHYNPMNKDGCANKLWQGVDINNDFIF